MKNKKIIVLGVATYMLAILLFNLWNYVQYIILPKNEDWEIFSYNLYGSVAFYVIAMILFVTIIWLIKSLKNKELIVILLILFLVEIPAMFIMGESIIVSIVKSIFYDNQGNYVSFVFPAALFISYFTCKKLLKYLRCQWEHD